LQKPFLVLMSLVVHKEIKESPLILI
jgi:hypothetical protein